MSTGMCVRSSLVLSPGVPPADAENVVDGVLADGEGSDGPADGRVAEDGLERVHDHRPGQLPHRREVVLHLGG